MSIKIDWLIEKRLIFIQVVGDMREEDAQLLLDRLKTLLSQTDGSTTVHILQDATLLQKPYTNFRKLTELFGYIRKVNGWYVVLNKPGNRLVGYVTAVAGQLLGLRTRPPFSDYATLRAFLLEQDAQLSLPTEAPSIYTQDEIHAILGVVTARN